MEETEISDSFEGASVQQRKSYSQTGRGKTRYLVDMPKIGENRGLTIPLPAPLTNAIPKSLALDCSTDMTWPLVLVVAPPPPPPVPVVVSPMPRPPVKVRLIASYPAQ